MLHPLDKFRIIHSNEGGLLAKHFLDIQFFWITSLGYAFTDSIVLLLGYFCNPKNNTFVKLFDKFGFDEKMDYDSLYKFSFGVRLQCIVIASFGTVFAINWLI